MKRASTRKKSRQLQRLLQRAFVAYGGNPGDVDDFVFHMLDWSDDLKTLSRIYSSPGRFSAAKEDSVYRFLMLATHHILEAYRLLNGEDCENIFHAPLRRKVDRKRTVVARGTRRSST